MRFEDTSVYNIYNAILGARNPKNSWNKSDSIFKGYNGKIENTVIGENDLKLLQSLIKAGSEHRKFMRQIGVSVIITAPLYWWKEFDTYKVGTVANSTSTMHKLASTPITLDCFEMDDFEDAGIGGCVSHGSTIYLWRNLIVYLEELRKQYNEIRDKLKHEQLTKQEIKHLNSMAKAYWKELIRLLPESWLQKRTVTMDYENLLSICSKSQRRFHKLTEWSKSFIDWARSLPYAQELIFIDEEPKLDFTIKHEDGIYKCRYSSGVEFESLDGVTWTKTLQ